MKSIRSCISISLVLIFALLASLMAYLLHSLPPFAFCLSRVILGILLLGNSFLSFSA